MTAPAPISVAGAPSPLAPPVVLASASGVRRRLLENAGVSVIIDPGRADEEEIKRAMHADGAPVEACAERLAEIKALRVSGRHQGAIVLGADQMLELDRVWFDKPADREQAAEQLAALAGRTHRLVSAVAAVRNGARIWGHAASARLTMRPLTRQFIGAYLAAAGDQALQSVGAYQLEGLGAQLFSRIEGDYFTVLGLPLLPVLAFLREHGVVMD
jgi:septum formation protein